MKKNVMVRVRGVQVESGLVGAEHADPIELVTAGVYRKVAGRHHIKYEENLSEEMGATRNHLVITDGCIEVHKKGEVDVDMIFEPGKTNISCYETPYGSLAMMISTTALEVKEAPNALAANIRYALSVNDRHVADCTMELRFRDR